MSNVSFSEQMSVAQNQKLIHYINGPLTDYWPASNSVSSNPRLIINQHIGQHVTDICTTVDWYIIDIWPTSPWHFTDTYSRCVCAIMAKELNSSTLSFFITSSDSFTGAVGISMENYILQIMYTCPVMLVFIEKHSGLTLSWRKSSACKAKIQQFLRMSREPKTGLGMHIVITCKINDKAVMSFSVTKSVAFSGTVSRIVTKLSYVSLHMFLRYFNTCSITTRYFFDHQFYVLHVLTVS